MKRFQLFFLIVLLAGLSFRLISLASRPFGFTWDEAALGYNAYSLLQTGRDEHGQIAPIIFKSFGDYKPGLYIYFTVLPTAVFGLNEFSTRLPSAVFGTLMLAVIYVLVRRLFPKSAAVAVAALCVAAVNPWLLHFSRGAWEANLSLFLTVLGTTLFLRSRTAKSNWWTIASACAFGLTLWTYQGGKMFTPLLILTLGLIYFKQLNFRRLLLPAVVFLCLLIPVLVGAAGQSGRLKVFSVFSYQRSSDYVSQLLQQDGTGGKNWLYYLYHTEFFDQLRGVAQRYLNHLSPRFLFLEGDWTNLRHAEYKQGYLYLVDLVPLLIGLIYLLRSRSRSTKLILAWMFLAPLPAAFSRDLVSGVRSLPLVLPLVVLISLGLAEIFKSRLGRVIYSLPALFLMVYFGEFYFLHAHFYAADQWVSAYRPAVQVVSAHLAEYPEVYFTDQLGQPYIFILYYLRYDPALYQKQAVFEASASGDVGRVTGFGNFHFQPIFWPQLRGKTQTMFIGGQYELPEKDLDFAGVNRLSDIIYPNGSLALRIVGLN
jgi:4-amino-4-deoxy-L-arabinose transferase-like glycosyltransferase